jgi:hypothetical protein
MISARVNLSQLEFIHGEWRRTPDDRWEGLMADKFLKSKLPRPDFFR